MSVGRTRHPRSRQDPFPLWLREVEEHRLQLDADEVHVPDPKTLEFVRNELPVSVEGVQDEHLVVAREHVGVRESGLGERAGRKTELDPDIPAEQAAEFRQVRAVALAQHDSHEPSRAPQGVEEQPEDFRRHRKGADAQDLSVAREDDFPQFAPDRFRSFVDPEVLIRPAVLRRGRLLQAADDLGRREEVVMPRLARLFADDSGRAGPIPIRSLLGDVDPALRLQGLQDAVDGGVLHAEELADLLGGRRAVLQEVKVRVGFFPREAEGLQGPDGILLPHRLRHRGSVQKDLRVIIPSMITCGGSTDSVIHSETMGLWGNR